MKKILIFSFVILLYPFSYGQQWLENLPDAKSQSELTLSDYKNAFDSYWEPYNVDKGYYIENGEKKKAAGWKQFNRWYWNMENQVDAQTGLFPQKSAQQVYDEFVKANPANKSDNAANWTSLGPNSSTGGYAGVGRINCVAFHPSDNNTYWVGAPAGGLWMTTDNGSSWTCLTDQNAVLGVSDIIIPSDYATSQTIYIGTGDRDAWDNRSVGVLKSTDGGSTWNTTDLQYTLAESKMVSRLLLDPNDDQTIIAATSNGVYKTTDGGANWDNQLSSVDFVDMEYKPGSFSTLYGSTKWGDIYTSTNSGASWTQVHDNGNRIELAVSPANANYVYAVVANSSSGLEGIYRSTNSGASFTLVFSGSTKALLNWSTDGSGTNNGQGWYDLSLAVSPSDENTVVVGGISSWKSTNGGSSWSLMNHWYGGGGAPAVHADKHQLKYRSNGDLFECNDGGVYISSNGGSSWTDKTNGMVISQMYKLGVAQTVNNETITGLQDNGTKLKSGSSWSDVKGGDGMECLIDYTDKNIQYGTYVNGQISRTINHWASSVDIEPTAAGDGAWVTPYIIDPDDHNTLYAGYADVWKTTNKGDSWTKISTMNTGSKIRSMAIAPSNNSVLYVADPYTLWKTTNGGSSWTDITGSLTNFANITYIAVKNDDPNTVWVTLSGYNSYGVYKTTDGGTNWTNMSTGLPQLPVYSIVQNYQFTEEVHLYVATELGVYFKQGDENWVEYNTGLPNVRGGELEIYYDDTPADSKLRYATYGRGLWESEMEQEAGGGEECDAPENLIAEIDSDEAMNVVLNWDDPTAFDPVWLQYGDGIVTNSIGGPTEFDVAAKFETAQIQDLDGGALKKIKFYYTADVDGIPVFTLRVWTGANAENLVYEQLVSNPVADSWNEIDLNTPVILNVNEALWFGYHIVTNDSYSAGTGAGYVDPNSDWVSMDGVTWEHLTDFVADVHWSLGGYVELADGKSATIGKQSIEAKSFESNGVFSLGNNIHETFGNPFVVASQSKELLSYNIYRDGTKINQDPVYDITYTDQLQSTATYCYEVTAVYSECGESEPSNEDCVIVEGSDETIVSINPNEQTISANETFTTTVEIANVTNLGSFELELNYDPAYLQASSVTLEDFISSTGRDLLPLANNIDNTNGLIEYAVSTLGATPPGADGDGVLLTVEWVSVGSVDNEVNTDILIQNLQVTDPEGTLIPTETTNGQVTILGPLSTTVVSQTGCPGTFLVPLTVTKFEDIAEFSLSLDYNNTELTYVNYQNLNAQLSGVTVTDNGTSIDIEYTGATSTIPNGEAILELEFTAPDVFVQTISNLTWDEASCSYTDGSSAVVIAGYTDGTVTINPLPAAAGNITGSTSICQGQLAETYSVDAITNADSYTWEITPAEAGTITATDTDITIDFSGTYSGNATLSVYATNACGDGASNSLTINVIAEATIAAGDDQDICEGETVTLAASATSYNVVIWTTSGDGSFDDASSLTAVYTPGATDIANGTATLSIEATPIAPCLANPSDDMVVSISLTPTANAGADAGICEDVSYTLTGAASNYQTIQWTTSGDGSFDSDDILGATYTPSVNDRDAGIVTLTLTATPNTPCAGDAVSTMELTIRQVPTSAAGDDQQICEGETVSLMGVATDYQSVLWTSNGDGSFDDATSLTAIYTPSANDITAGTVSLTLTATEIAPCITNASDDMVVSISLTPTANAGADAGICEDVSYTLTGAASNYQTIQWTTSGDGSFDSDDILGATYTPSANDRNAGLVTLTLTATPNTPCAGDAVSTMELTVGQVPTAAAGDDQQICEGETVSLMGVATDFQSVLWTSNGDGSFDDATSLTAIYTPSANDITAGTVSLTLTATEIAPCITNASDDMVVSISLTPTANAGADAGICEDVSYTLTGAASNYQSIQWTTSGDGSFDSDDILGATYTPSANDRNTGLVTLTLTATPNTPCPDNAVSSMELTVGQVPTVAAGDNQDICEGETVSLMGVATDYQSVLWTSNGDGSFDDATSLTAIYTPSANDITSGTVSLTLTATEIAPCITNASDDMVVSISLTPTANAGADAGICEDVSYTLTGAASNYQSIQWTTSGDGSFDSDDILGATYTPSANDRNTGLVTLTLTATPNTPCAGDAVSTMELTVGQVPTADAGDDQEICEGETVNLAGIAANYQNILWSSAGDGTFDDATSLTAVYTPGVNDINIGTAVLTLTANEMAPCITNATDDMIVTIVLAPTANAGADAGICEDLSYTLNGIATNYQTIQWTTSGDGSFDSDDILGATYTPSANDRTAGLVTLTLTATPNTPCAGDAVSTMELTVGQVPTAAAGDDQEICEGETVSLVGNATDYQNTLWSTSGDGTFDDATSLTAIYTPGANDAIAGTVDLTLTANEFLPCITTATDDLTVTINSLPTAPTAVNASELLIYPGESSELTYTGGDGTVFNWFTSSCGGDLVGTGNNLVVSPITTTTYYGRWENNCGESNCEEIEVVVDYHNTTMQITPADQLVSTAEVFTTQVEITGVTNLGGFELEIDFDPALLQANSVTLEPFLTSTGRPALPLNNSIDNANGLIEYAVSTMGAAPAGPDGDGALLTIEWTSTASVPDDVITDIILQNIQATHPNADVIPVNIYHGEVTIIGAVSTEVVSQQACPGSVNLPINVTSFKDVTAFSIELEYNNTELTYTGFQNPNALLSNIDVVDNGDNIVMSYTGNATTIPNGSTLVELVFDTPENTFEVISNLTWDLANSAYTDVDGDMDVAFDDGTITIDPIPHDAGEITGLTSVCQGLAGEIYSIAAITFADDYTWELTPAEAGTATPNNTEITIDFAADFAGQATLNVFATNTCGTGVANSINIDVIAYPTAAAGDDATICEDVTFTCQGVATDQQSVLWTTSGDGTFDDATALNAVYTPGANDITAGTATLEMTAYAILPCAVDASDDMVLTIQPTPTADAGADDAICEDVTYQLNGTVTNNASFFWSTSGDGSFDDDASLTAIYTPGAIDIANGTATLSLTAVAVGPCADNFVDDMVLTIELNAIVDAGSDDGICEDPNFTMAATASNYLSLLWTTSGDGTFNDATALNAVYTPGANDITIGEATLTLTAQPNNPCSTVVSDDMVLTVGQVPTVDAGVDQLVCDSEVVNLSAVADNYATLLWTTAGDGSFDDATSLMAVYTPGTNDIAAGTVVLTITAEEITPCITNAIDDMEVTIVLSPTAYAGIDDIICDNATYTLAGVVENEQSILWTTSGDGSFDDATIETATYTPGANDITNGTVDLTITAFAANPCSVDAADVMTLLIQNLPSVDAGADDEICETETYSLSANAQNYQTLTWSTDGDGTFDDVTSLSAVYTHGPNDVITGSVVLSLSVDSPCGATAEDDMTLTVQGAATVDAGADAVICDIETHTLNGMATYQASILWTTDGDGTFDDAAILNATYTPGANDILNEGVTLTLTAFAEAPCANDVTDNMFLEIYGVPTVDAGIDVTICEDGVFETDASAEHYSTLLWSTSGDGSFDDATALDAIYTPGDGDIAIGSVTLSIYAATQCGAENTDDMLLSISGLPNVNAGADDAICQGSPYQLDASAENPASVLWTTSGDGTFDDASIVDAVYNPGSQDLANGEVDLMITITPMAPCSSDVSDEMTLEVVHNPVVVAGDYDYVCENGSAQLYGYAGYAESFEWTTSGDGTFDDPNTEYAMYTPGPGDIEIGSAILTLTVYPMAPCTDPVSDFLIMSVISLPEANAGADGEICGDEMFQLDGSVDNAYMAVWSTSGDGSFDDANDLDAIYTPGVMDMDNGSVTLTLTAIANNPCSDNAVDQLELEVLPVVGYVNTPEGDIAVFTDETPTSVYTVDVDYGTDFNWVIYPPTAGQIEDGNAMTTVTWNGNYSGMAEIYVRASTECNYMLSDILEVRVNYPVGVGESLDIENRISIQPNPNNGIFNLALEGILGDIEYEITNSNGAIIKTEKLELKSTDYQTIGFNLSDQANGVYFIRIIHNDKVSIKKFILNN